MIVSTTDLAIHIKYNLLLLNLQYILYCDNNYLNRLFKNITNVNYALFQFVLLSKEYTIDQPTTLSPTVYTSSIPCNSCS